MRRVRPWALLLVGLPILELVILVVLAMTIGVGWTLLGLFLSAVAGFLVVKWSGGKALRELRESGATGQRPARSVVDNAMTTLGGLLLIPPGVLTDLAALVLILPFTRPLVRRWIEAWAVRQGSMAVQQRMYVSMPPRTNAPYTQGPHRPGGRDVVQGEVVDPDD